MAADWWEEIKRRDFGEGGAGTAGGTAGAWWRAAPLATEAGETRIGFLRGLARGADRSLAGMIGGARALEAAGEQAFTGLLGRLFEPAEARAGRYLRAYGPPQERRLDPSDAEPLIPPGTTLGDVLAGPEARTARLLERASEPITKPGERLTGAGAAGALVGQFLPALAAGGPVGAAARALGAPLAMAGVGATVPLSVQFGAQRYGELRRKGVPEDEASRAATLEGAILAAGGALPVSAAGALGRRLLTGGALTAAGDAAARAAANQALAPEHREPLVDETTGTAAAFGAALGALFGPRARGAAGLVDRAAGVSEPAARPPAAREAATPRLPDVLAQALREARSPGTEPPGARAEHVRDAGVQAPAPERSGMPPEPAHGLAGDAAGRGAGSATKSPENAFARISDGVRDTVRPEGAERTVYTADGRPVETRYALVELDDLVASHTPEGARNPRYPSELQPRERDRIASQAQIERIARELKPELLGDSPHAGEGAPIVGPDGVVESGNGRVAALARAYQVGTGERYRAFLEQEAARLGLDPAQVRAMRRPVLVRVRQTPMAGPERVRFAQEANRATVAPMAPAEQARADARLLTDDDILLFRPDDEGNVLARSNEDFLRRFAQRIGEQEAGGLMTPDGRWTKQAADRVTAAIFARAYDDSRLVQLMAEEADPGIRNVLRALVMAAPDYARARALDPDLGGLDLPRAVAEAADLVRRSRSERRALEELIGQQGLFGDAIAPEVAQIARLMDVNMRSPRRLAEALRAMGRGLLSYLEGARSGSLFDEAPPSLADLVQAGVREVQAHGGAGERQGDLLGAAQARAGEPHHPGVAPRGRGDREPSAGGRASAEDAATAGRGPEEPPALTRSPDGPPRLSGPLPDDVRSAAREVLAARQRELEAAVRRTLSGWAEAPPVRIVRSVDELPFRAPHDVEGAWYRGTVWLVADNLPNAARAATVVLHEAVGHGGIRRLLGSRLNDLLDEVWGAYAAGRLKERDPYFDLRRIAETYELDLATPEGRRTAAEEYLARLAERGVENGWLRRLLVRLRNWLRRYFPGLELTRDELVELVARARGFVERGRADRGTAELVAGLSRSGRRRDIPQLDEPYRLDSPEADARLDELYVRAHEAKPEFDRILREVAEEVGGDVVLAPLKGRRRAVEKISADYNGDPDLIKDLLRGTIVVDRADDVARALTAVTRRFGDVELVRNRWDESVRDLSDGYRDAMLRVRIGDVVAEVQVNTRPMLEAKKRMHALYERAQQILRRADAEQRPLSESERAEVERLFETQRKAYDAAAARSLRRDTRALNSDSVIWRPSEYTPVAGKRRGGSVSKAQASVGESSRTGMPDTSKKAGYDFSLKNIGVPSIQSIARLEEAPDRYFDLSGKHRFLPLDRLVPAKPEEAVRESAARAARHMADAAAGRIPKRAPLTVRRLPDGRYEVLDGNSTLAVAGASGWREVPVRVVDGEEGARLSRATSAGASEPAGGRSFADWYRKRVAQPAWDLLARKAKAILGARLLVRRGMELADTTPVEFRRMLRRYRAEILRAGRLARDVMEAARDLTPQERALISDYIEGELQAGVVPPQRIIEIAQRMQAALDAQGEELVRLGMLSKEARERWRGRYLPRFYSKHILENPWDKALRAAHKRIDGTHLMGRGLYETVPKRLVDRYRKLGWEIRQPEQADLARLGDEDPVLMWRDFTPEERARMGEIRDAAYRFARGYLEIQKDIALGRLYEQVARRIARDVQPDEDWVRVPDVTVPNTGGLKRYGALAGKWVPADVWHALEAARGPTSDLMRAYLKALSFWKEGKTALNPVVHGNNVISTIVMADLAGVHLYTRSGWKLYREALREYLRKGPVFREAQDAGLFGTEFYGAEIREMLPELAAGPASPDKVAETVVTKLTRALAETAGKPVSFYRRKMGRLYEAEDQFFKLLLYMDARRRGASVDDAIDWAERWVFNYADIPEGVRKIKTWALPFFSYTYKAIPALTYAAVNYPWRFVPWIALFGGLNWYAYESLYGANAREREEFERKVLPEYMRGYTVIGVPKAVRLPVNTPDGGALFLDLSRRMPLGDLFDATNQLGGVPLLQPFMPNNPVLTLMAGLLWNKDSFTGARIVEESDTAWDAAQKRAEWLWRQLAPNTPVLPGTYSWNKAMNGIAAALGRPIGVGPIEYTGKDYYGREQSLPRALADVLTGTKIRRVDIELERRKRILEIERMIRQKRAEMRAVGRRKSVGAMSEELADARLKKLRERIRMLRQKQAEYAGGP